MSDTDLLSQFLRLEHFLRPIWLPFKLVSASEQPDERYMWIKYVEKYVALIVKSRKILCTLRPRI